MEVIYGLIPLMIIIGLAMVVIFFWSVKDGQYEDMEGDSNRILMDEDEDQPKPESESESGTEKKSPADNKEFDKRNWPDAD